MAKITRDIIEIDEELCNGCGQCLLDCAEGALVLVDGKAKVIADIYCDGLGACLSGCPTGALRIVQKETEPFDEEAVKRHLGLKEIPLARELPPSLGPQEDWPLKVRLVRPDAPGLRGKPLVVAADCAAFAAASFHPELGKGKRLLIACPKFEEYDGLVRHLAEIFRQAAPAELTVVRMEVPCCRGLIRACLEAKALSGVDVPIKEAVISRRGEIHQENAEAV